MKNKTIPKIKKKKKKKLKQIWGGLKITTTVLITLDSVDPRLKIARESVGKLKSSRNSSN